MFIFLIIGIACWGYAYLDVVRDKNKLKEALKAACLVMDEEPKNEQAVLAAKQILNSIA